MTIFTEINNREDMKYPVLSGIVLSLLVAVPAAAQSFEEA